MPQASRQGLPPRSGIQAELPIRKRASATMSRPFYPALIEVSVRYFDRSPAVFTAMTRYSCFLPGSAFASLKVMGTRGMAGVSLY